MFNVQKLIQNLINISISWHIIRQGMGDGKYAPVQIFCSPTIVRKDNAKPMCSYFDVSFLDPGSLIGSPLHALVFDNFYVSSISCAQQISDGTEFIILDRKLLMPSNASAEGSQQTFHILTSEFNSRYQEALPIRIYLFQPSPQWTSFDLKNVKAFALDLVGREPAGMGRLPLAHDLALLAEAISCRQRASRSIHNSVQQVGNLVERGKLKKVKIKAAA